MLLCTSRPGSSVWPDALPVPPHPHLTALLTPPPLPSSCQTSPPHQSRVPSPPPHTPSPQEHQILTSVLQESCPCQQQLNHSRCQVQRLLVQLQRLLLIP